MSATAPGAAPAWRRLGAAVVVALAMAIAAGRPVAQPAPPDDPHHPRAVARIDFPRGRESAVAADAWLARTLGLDESAGATAPFATWWDGAVDPAALPHVDAGAPMAFVYLDPTLTIDPLYVLLRGPDPEALEEALRGADWVAGRLGDQVAASRSMRTLDAAPYEGLVRRPPATTADDLVVVTITPARFTARVRGHVEATLPPLVAQWLAARRHPLAVLAVRLGIGRDELARRATTALLDLAEQSDRIVLRLRGEGGSRRASLTFHPVSAGTLARLAEWNPGAPLIGRGAAALPWEPPADGAGTRRRLLVADLPWGWLAGQLALDASFDPASGALPDLARWLAARTLRDAEGTVFAARDEATDGDAATFRLFAPIDDDHFPAWASEVAPLLTARPEVLRWSGEEGAALAFVSAGMEDSRAMDSGAPGPASGGATSAASTAKDGDAGVQLLGAWLPADPEEVAESEPVASLVRLGAPYPAGVRLVGGAIDDQIAPPPGRPAAPEWPIEALLPGDPAGLRLIYAGPADELVALLVPPPAPAPRGRWCVVLGVADGAWVLHLAPMPDGW